MANNYFTDEEWESEKGIIFNFYRQNNLFLKSLVSLTNSGSLEFYIKITTENSSDYREIWVTRDKEIYQVLLTHKLSALAFTAKELKFFDLRGYHLKSSFATAVKQRIEDWIYDV